MKKQQVKSLRLVKENVSKLEVSEIDKLKGGSQGGHPTNCNTWHKCDLH